MASARVNGRHRPLHAADWRPAGSSLHRVVGVGGGFGGVHTVKALCAAPVQVTLIDRNSYHLFQPLTYQVATGALSPAEIGKPLRTIFRGEPNPRTGGALDHPGAGTRRRRRRHFASARRCR
jgi:hypothetical protein